MFKAALTYLLGEITKKPRLTMEWLPNNYAKLMVTHGVQIDMMNYPGGQIIEPKCAVIHHLHEVISGWKNGQIKWVRLSEAEVEKQKEILDLDAPTNEEAEWMETGSHDSGTFYFSVYISNNMGMQFTD